MRKKVSGEDVGDLSLDDDEDDAPAPRSKKSVPGNEAQGMA